MVVQFSEMENLEIDFVEKMIVSVLRCLCDVQVTVQWSVFIWVGTQERSLFRVRLRMISMKTHREASLQRIAGAGLKLSTHGGPRG